MRVSKKLHNKLAALLFVIAGSLFINSHAFAKFESHLSLGAHHELLIPQSSLNPAIGGFEFLGAPTASSNELGQNPFAISNRPELDIACKHVECHRLPPKELAFFQ